MCSIYILQIILQIAEIINELTFARFQAKDAELDRQLAALPWGDRINVKKPEDRPLPTLQEITVRAQKAFLLLCDLYRISIDGEKDIDAIHKSTVYISKLAEVVSTTQGFKKAHMDNVAESSYTEACKQLDIRGWYTGKADLMVCRGLIFTSPEGSESQQYALPSSGDGDSTVTTTNVNSWGAFDTDVNV